MNNGNPNIQVLKANETGIFTNYIYKAIPLAFDESMSYYECLCGLLEYLKNTILPTLNNNADAIIELQNLYNELHNYVEHYFDNLDVQEEINNKLDDMAESGELTDIIAQYLGLAGMITFDTVADMKLAENLVNGSKCATLGYRTVNDGGNAFYKIRTITNEDTVDEASIIALHDNSLVAELINENINLIQFGCYGDGTHDDTSYIKKAFIYATNTNKSIISPVNKTYLISELLTIPNVNLNLTYCIFKTEYGIKITANNKILNFPQIIAPSDLSTATGLELYECYTNKINIPMIRGYAIGLLLSANEHGTTDNNITIQEIRNCLNSLKLYASDNGWVNENLFVGGRLWNDTSYITSHGSDIKLIYIQGTSLHNANNNHFINQCIEGDEGTSNGIKIKMDYASYCVFDSLRYEGSDAKIDITNSDRNIFNNGFNLPYVTFINDSNSCILNGISEKIVKGGSTGGVYLDVQMSSNGYPSLQTKRTDGTIAHKLTPNGIVMHNASGTQTLRLDETSLSNYYNNTWNRMIGYYHQYTLIPNCNVTNKCFVISSSTNLSSACFLWIYDGHLYGKMSEPNSESDGTIIL